MSRGGRPRLQVPRHLVGIAALFSGAALVGHILAGLSLWLALVFTATLVAVLVGVIVRQTDLERRRRLLAQLKVGLVAGVAATLAYDGFRWLLMQIDPSPFDAFEALRTFGLLLVGDRSAATVLAVGTAFHALNGITFAIGFVILFPRARVVGGIAWGLFLYLIQLVLYPGWLGIQLVREFSTISLLGHIAYGSTLGWVALRGRRRSARLMVVVP